MNPFRNTYLSHILIVLGFVVLCIGALIALPALNVWAILAIVIVLGFTGLYVVAPAWRDFNNFVGQVGGYVHNTTMTQFITPLQMFGDTAAWTFGAGQVSGSLVYKCDATDEVANLFIPIPVMSNSVDQQGVYLRSIEVDFEILIAALDVLTPVIYKMTRGADGADVVVATPTFTYDAGHDTAAERIDVDEHKMTLTLDTPIWVDNDVYLWLKLPFDKAATSTVEVLGAFANFTLRL